MKQSVQILDVYSVCHCLSLAYPSRLFGLAGRRLERTQQERDKNKNKALETTMPETVRVCLHAPSHLDKSTCANEFVSTHFRW